MEMNTELEKAIEIKLIQEDVETVLSLIHTEYDPIFVLAIMPYYALFVQSCQEYWEDSIPDDDFSKQVKDIRNYIKAFDVGLSKSMKRVKNVDSQQDQEFTSILRFAFMKSWNIHYNLGSYWTGDRHAIGNTQMYADFLRIEHINNRVAGEKMRDFGYKMGKYIASVKSVLEQITTPAKVKRVRSGITIEYYCDLNTNKKNPFFIFKEKELNLFFLNLVSNLNFVKLILRPLLTDTNAWLFRVEYVVTYYTYRALWRLKNYCENNKDIVVDMTDLIAAIEMNTAIFQSKFRNCMMHYGIQNQGVVSIDNIEKPLFGMVETCFEGMGFSAYQSKLRNLEDRMIEYLEGYFNTDKIILQKLER